MQARLFDRLGEWAVMDDGKLAQSLADLDSRAPDSLSGADLSKARRLFAKALETPGGLKIQTIHAFCEKLLRRFPIEAGVTPGFTVLENEAALALSHGPTRRRRRSRPTSCAGSTGTNGWQSRRRWRPARSTTRNAPIGCSPRRGTSPASAASS